MPEQFILQYVNSLRDITAFHLNAVLACSRIMTGRLLLSSVSVSFNGRAWPRSVEFCAKSLRLQHNAAVLASSYWLASGMLQLPESRRPATLALRAAFAAESSTVHCSCGGG